MSRCLYSSGIKRFLSLDDNLIFGTLCDKYHGDAPTTTREAWKGEILVMKSLLSNYADKEGKIGQPIGCPIGLRHTTPFERLVI